MNPEIYAALDQLEKERGIPKDYMLEKISDALKNAYSKNKVGYTENVTVELNDGVLRMYAQKEAVEDVMLPATEINIEAARKIDKHVQLGDLINVDVDTKNQRLNYS